MATNDIGRVTPIWRGFYSAAATYELNDIVIDTSGSVWWHKSEELTTGVVPAAGEIWDAVIDMSVFSGLIQAAITTAQTALAAAQAALADVAADMERAETAADNAENSAAAASESAAGVGALAQAAAASAEAAAGSATGAAGSAQAAAGSKSDAEAYAVGKRGGEDVGSTDPTYHNNAKYYAEQAASEAEAAAQSAEDAQDVLDSIPEDYSQMSADVGDLKTQVNDLDETVNGTVSMNYVEGKNLDADGALTDDLTCCVSEKIPYTWEGLTRYFCNDNTSTKYAISFYDANDVKLARYQMPSSSGGNEYRDINGANVEGTISYVRFSFKKNTTGKVQSRTSPYDYIWNSNEESTGGLTSDVSKLQEDFVESQDNITEIQSDIYGTYEANYIEDKNIDTNTGDIIDNVGFSVSDKIPFVSGWGAVDYYAIPESGDSASSGVVVACYNSNDELLGYITGVNLDQTFRRFNGDNKDYSASISYIRFSFKKSYDSKAVKNSVSNPEVYYEAGETIVENGLAQNVEKLESYHTEKVFPNWLHGRYRQTEDIRPPLEDTYMRTDYVPVFDGIKIDPGSSHKINVGYYTITGAAIKHVPENSGSTYGYTTETVEIKKGEAAFVRLMARRTNETAMPDPKTEGLNISIERYGHEYVFSTEFDGVPNDPNVDIDQELPKYLALVACREKYESGKMIKTLGYLYRTVVAPHKLYYASGRPENIRFLCDWNMTLAEQNVAVGRATPNYYSYAVTDEGDIVCVYKGEIVSTYPRANPIVYPHDDLEHPVIVDLSAKTAKPTAWISNCGMFTAPGEMWFGEYIRDQHAYAYVWKVEAPYTDSSNWTIMKEFERDDVSNPSMIPGKIEHIHHVAKDPFTGIIYVTTGDHYAESGIYYYKDSEWGILREADESVCRQLNFIFTPTYIYWASDAHVQYNPDSGEMEEGAHRFFRATRNENGLIDLDTLDIYSFDDLLSATVTYHVCYIENPHCILILDRHESNSALCTIPFKVWNIDKERLEIAGTFTNVEFSENSIFGFRTECTQHYPNLFNNDIANGFSLYPNFIECLSNPPRGTIPTMASDDTVNKDRVNSLVLKVSLK